MAHGTALRQERIDEWDENRWLDEQLEPCTRCDLLYKCQRPCGSIFQDHRLGRYYTELIEGRHELLNRSDRFWTAYCGLKFCRELCGECGEFLPPANRFGRYKCGVARGLYQKKNASGDTLHGYIETFCLENLTTLSFCIEYLDSVRPAWKLHPRGARPPARFVKQKPKPPEPTGGKFEIYLDDNKKEDLF